MARTVGSNSSFSSFRLVTVPQKVTVNIPGKACNQHDYVVIPALFLVRRKMHFFSMHWSAGIKLASLPHPTCLIAEALSSYEIPWTRVPQARPRGARVLLLEEVTTFPPVPQRPTEAECQASPLQPLPAPFFP